jgi:hypothetical protein
LKLRNAEFSPAVNVCKFACPIRGDVEKGIREADTKVIMSRDTNATGTLRINEHTKLL